MPSKQELRSEETKKSILAAAGKLFAHKGYEVVTMREIAKEAGCSHTTIYIYFKDKEALLHKLSMPPLLALTERFDVLIAREGAPEEKLKAVSMAFVAFCLTHRNTYGLIFMVKSGRVDDQAPGTELHQTRNRLFAMLSGALRACLRSGISDEGLLAYSRIYFFALHGIVATYASSEETVDQLLARLAPTFELTFEVLMVGIRRKADESGT